MHWHYSEGISRAEQTIFSSVGGKRSKIIFIYEFLSSIYIKRGGKMSTETLFGHYFIVPKFPTTDPSEIKKSQCKRRELVIRAITR